MDLAKIQKLDEEFILHTYARLPVAFVRGENAKLFDTQGKDYIDFGAGIAVCSVGHANKQLASAIATQAQNLLHTSNLYYIQNQAALAQSLITLYLDKMPEKKQMRAFFCNSGAEANECAIKIARKYGKSKNAYKIITLDSSFHGRTIASLKATAQEKMHADFGPYPDGFIYAKDLDDVYNHLDSHTCAVLLELVQGEGGICPMDREKIIALGTHLRAKGILLMVDEVQTGIYRCGEIFASKVYGITPDVISTAKGLAGGVPIGAVMTSLVDIFEPSDHGSTFGGNFLSTSAALEVLEILFEHKQSGELDKTITYFTQKLQDLQKHYAEIFTQEVGLGLMRGLRVRDLETLTKFLNATFEAGVLVLKSGKNTARFLPSLTITREEIDEGFLRIESCIAHL